MMKQPCRVGLFMLMTMWMTVPSYASVLVSEDFTQACPYPNTWSFSYGSNNCPNLAPTANLVAGEGQALDATLFVPGGVYPYTFSSSGSGGIHTYSPLTGSLQTDLYYGYYVQWSNPFDWNPVGTKFNYVTTRDIALGNEGSSNDNFLLMIQGASGQTLTFTQQLQHCLRPITIGQNTCTQNRFNNQSGWAPIVKGRTYWIAVHAKMNTWRCAEVTTYTCANPDGQIQVYVNGNLAMDHRNVVHSVRPGNVFRNFQFAFIWGGGGGTVNQPQTTRYDHLRIGTSIADVILPDGGTAPPIDTVPPTPPTSFTVQ